MGEGFTEHTVVQSYKASLAWQGLQGDALKGPALQGREGSQAPQSARPVGAQLRIHACRSTAALQSRVRYQRRLKQHHVPVR